MARRKEAQILCVFKPTVAKSRGKRCPLGRVVLCLKRVITLDVGSEQGIHILECRFSTWASKITAGIISKKFSAIKPSQRAEPLHQMDVKCGGCGAVSKIIRGETAECEYCGVLVSSIQQTSADVGVNPAYKDDRRYKVIIKNVGANRITQIKLVREITGLGLREAKDLVCSAPQTVLENISMAAAEDIKKKLEKAGAVIEII